MPLKASGCCNAVYTEVVRILKSGWLARKLTTLVRVEVSAIGISVSCTMRCKTAVGSSANNWCCKATAKFRFFSSSVDPAIVDEKKRNFAVALQHKLFAL